MHGLNLIQKQSDIAYRPTLHLPSYWACGDMTRGSEKYPSVFSWSVDTRYSSRAGGWENNLTSDYEYLYEFVTGAIQENAANDEKFKRLKERAFLTADNRVNIMMVLGNADDFFAKNPGLLLQAERRICRAGFGNRHDRGQRLSSANAGFNHQHRGEQLYRSNRRFNGNGFSL